MSIPGYFNLKQAMALHWLHRVAVISTAYIKSGHLLPLTTDGAATDFLLPRRPPTRALDRPQILEAVQFGGLEKEMPSGVNNADLMVLQVLVANLRRWSGE